MRSDDDSLVQASVDGDVEAFGELIDRYQKAVFNVAYRMVYDREDARDIAQTVFSNAFRSLHRFDTRHRFQSWIHRITINESIKFLDRRRPSGTLDPDMPSDAPTPEDRAGVAETCEAVQDALMDLKPEHRAVLILRHYLSCTYAEMAGLLDIPEKTVKSRLFTARRALRDVLAGSGMAP